jgi:type II secretory pathway pseudopilin PulG
MLWGVLLRIGTRYVFFRRWRNLLILSGALLLCAMAAILLDAKMYLSAGVVGVIGALALITFPLQYFRVRRENRERERRNVVEAARRAEAARIRGEQIDTAKKMVADAARAATSSATNVADLGLRATFAAAETATTSAANVAGLAKTGFSGALDRLNSWRKKSVQ